MRALVCNFVQRIYSQFVLPMQFIDAGREETSIQPSQYLPCLEVCIPKCEYHVSEQRGFIQLLNPHLVPRWLLLVCGFFLFFFYYFLFLFYFIFFKECLNISTGTTVTLAPFSHLLCNPYCLSIPHSHLVSEMPAQVPISQY